MATKKLYDLAVKTGTYKDRDGNEKGKWQNVGAVLEKDDGGKYILLERWFNPAGIANPENRSNVLISMFKPEQNGKGQSSESKPASAGESYEDDIPF